MQNKLEEMLKKAPTEYRGLETRLQATLKPVTPRPEFVGDLRRRLTHLALYPEPNTQLDNGQILLMIAVSLLSIVLIVVMSARAIALLASGLGIIQQVRRRKPDDHRVLPSSAGLTHRPV